MVSDRSHVTVEYDPEEDCYQASYDIEKVNPSLAVVEAVAAVKEIEILAVEPLGTTIDLEALDSVLQSGTGQSDPTVTFRTQEYEIILYKNELVLQQLDSEPGDAATTD